MWELDHKASWVPKIDAFELWCWRSLLRVPWPARRSNQSILKEIHPEYSLDAETPMLWPRGVKNCHWKRPWCWERLKVVRKGKEWMKWLDGITDSMDMEFEQAPGVSDRQGGLACSRLWGHKELDQKEGLAWKNRCFRTVVLEKTLESPFACKEIRPVHF